MLWLCTYSTRQKKSWHTFENNAVATLRPAMLRPVIKQRSMHSPRPFIKQQSMRYNNNIHRCKNGVVVTTLTAVKWLAIIIK